MTPYTEGGRGLAESEGGAGKYSPQVSPQGLINSINKRSAMGEMPQEQEVPEMDEETMGLVQRMLKMLGMQRKDTTDQAAQAGIDPLYK